MEETTSSSIIQDNHDEPEDSQGKFCACNSLIHFCYTLHRNNLIFIHLSSYLLEKKQPNKRKSIDNTSQNCEDVFTDDEFYYPEELLSLKYYQEEKQWKVLVKWKDYDKTHNSWQGTHVIQDNQQLIPYLLKNMKIKQLPDITKPPVKNKKTKKHVTKVAGNSPNLGCPLKIHHGSRDLKTKIKDLVQEDNRQYIKKGYYLHGNRCKKCSKEFVLNITNELTETTITKNQHAWRCPHTALCTPTYVWCDACYKDVLVDDEGQNNSRRNK